MTKKFPIAQNVNLLLLPCFDPVSITLYYAITSTLLPKGNADKCIWKLSSSSTSGRYWKKYFQVLKKTTQTRIKNEEREKKKKKRKTTLDKWSQETCRSVCTCRVAQMVTDDYTVKLFRKWADGDSSSKWLLGSDCHKWSGKHPQ